MGVDRYFEAREEERIKELRELLHEFWSYVDPDSYYHYEIINKFLRDHGYIHEKCKHENKKPATNAGGFHKPEFGYTCLDCKEHVSQ